MAENPDRAPTTQEDIIEALSAALDKIEAGDRITALALICKSDALHLKLALDAIANQALQIRALGMRVKALEQERG